jgi:hypothetical protein
MLGTFWLRLLATAGQTKAAPSDPIGTEGKNCYHPLLINATVDDDEKSTFFRSGSLVSQSKNYDIRLPCRYLDKNFGGTVVRQELQRYGPLFPDGGKTSNGIISKNLIV